MLPLETMEPKWNRPFKSTFQDTEQESVGGLRGNWTRASTCFSKYTSSEAGVGAGKKCQGPVYKKQKEPEYSEKAQQP